MEGNESNIFNLGNGVGFTVKEVIETARKVTGKPIKAVEEGRRAGDPAVLIASSEKAKNILGWKPEHCIRMEMAQQPPTRILFCSKGRQITLFEP